MANNSFSDPERQKLMSPEYRKAIMDLAALIEPEFIRQWYQWDRPDTPTYEDFGEYLQEHWLETVAEDLIDITLDDFHSKH